MHDRRGSAGRLCPYLIALILCLFTSAAKTAVPLAGDLAPRGNPDGELNVADVLILQRIVFELITPTTQEFQAGDIAPLGNPDGVLDAADLMLLIRAVLGEITLPPLLDDIAPALADGSLISVIDHGTGLVSVIGSPVSVEAGATVHMINYETGSTSQVVANTDGSFSAELVADDRQVFGLYVVDASDNRSIPISLGVGEILTLTVDSPADGATIVDNRVQVSGTFSGPLNTSVTVNGVVACTDGNGFFASDVPLVQGENDLEVTVQMADGLTISRTVTVTSTESPAVRSRVDPPCGIAPHSVQFSVESTNSDPIIEVELDVNNDGVVDYLIPASALPFEYAYMSPGSYQAEVTVHESGGAQYNFIHQILVSDAAVPDLVLRDTYTGMLSRLTNGAVDGALNKVSGGVYEKYRQVFEALQPNLPDIVTQLGVLHAGAIGNDMAEYIVTRESSGNQYAYFIYFIRDEDGIWRIDGM